MEAPSILVGLFFCCIFNIVLTCEEGWISFDSSCYKYFDTKMSWTTAQSKCRELGADMVVIRSDEENNFLVDLFNAKWQNRPWIGMNDRNTESRFEWVNTQECSQYTNFRQGEPNDHDRMEDCVMLSHFKWWNDVLCSIKNAYICEKNNFQDTEPPSYGSTCPEDIHLLIKPNENSVSAFWHPPEWTDDSYCFFNKINSHDPGHVMTIPNGNLGSMVTVTYSATDMVGRSTTCSFQITASYSETHCLNGGTLLTSNEGTISCLCVEGFSGLICEVNPNSNKCLNGGTLLTTIEGTILCLCADGFSGLVCEVNMTEYRKTSNQTQVFKNVDSSKCLNGGTLSTTTEGTIYCLCAAGFSGSVCEVNTGVSTGSNDFIYVTIAVLCMAIILLVVSVDKFKHIKLRDNTVHFQKFSATCKMNSGYVDIESKESEPNST